MSKLAADFVVPLEGQRVVAPLYHVANGFVIKKAVHLRNKLLHRRDEVRVVSDREDYMKQFEAMRDCAIQEILPSPCFNL